ncbi:MAG: hypothetical protein SFY80_02260 [Verrucomicrobiota bacterium]|nr:hypothetical protein [Verrucomicrobiota bacterium]
MLSLFRKSKPEPEDVAAFIREHTPQINGSLCVFGDWFGRPMDNWHQLLSHEAKEGYVRLLFNEGETLEVWNPAGVRMEGKSFVVQGASRVRWEWFYYGRSKFPVNRFFIEHVVSGEKIEACSDANWAPHSFKPSRAEPAVSIT